MKFMPPPGVFAKYQRSFLRMLYRPTTFARILLNPRLDPEKRSHIRCLLKKHRIHEKFKNHVFLASSGTTQDKNGSFKLIALSKKALITSAQAVNQHLRATAEDIWLNCLPLFHVGGLGINIRASLSCSKVITFSKWDPFEFVKKLKNNRITLTSLVPTQVFDIVTNKLEAPKSLRAIVVGGGAMNDHLYSKAIELGWPLLVSYGLTECSSQVATSKPFEKNLELLQHVEARVNDNGFLELKSKSLLSANIFIEGFKVIVSDPKYDGWFTTEDMAEINENSLTIHGRANNFFKIGGESVLFSSLEKRWEEIRLKCLSENDSALMAYPDERLGYVIHLASTSSEISALVEAFNSSVMPYEFIRKIHLVDHIPRTALNKVRKTDLLTKIKDMGV
jgi:O-succinylbenzoic acid--CoA ligase